MARFAHVECCDHFVGIALVLHEHVFVAAKIHIYAVPGCQSSKSFPASYVVKEPVLLMHFWIPGFASPR